MSIHKMQIVQLYHETYERYDQHFEDAVKQFEETDLGTMWMIQYDLNGNLLPRAFAEEVWMKFIKTIPSLYNSLEFAEYNTHYVNLYKKPHKTS